MAASQAGEKCELCRQPFDARHSRQAQGAASAGRPGKRAEYVVVELRGAIAHYRAADDPARTFKTAAGGLAKELGIDEPDLLGCRYTCWVEPAEHGVIRSDFRLSWCP